MNLHHESRCRSYAADVPIPGELEETPSNCVSQHHFWITRPYCLQVWEEMHEDLTAVCEQGQTAVLYDRECPIVVSEQSVECKYSICCQGKSSSSETHSSNSSAQSSSSSNANCCLEFELDSSTSHIVVQAEHNTLADLEELSDKACREAREGAENLAHNCEEESEQCKQGTCESKNSAQTCRFSNKYEIEVEEGLCTLASENGPSSCVCTSKVICKCECS